MNRRKIAIAAFSLGLLAFGACVAISGNDAVQVRAEASSVVADESAEAETWYEDAIGWVENKIIPIMGSSAVVSILSAATAVGTALAKRAGDKKTKKVIELQSASLSNLEKAIQDMAKIQATSIDGYEESYKSAMKCLEQASKQVEEMGSIAKEQTAKMENVVAMKESIDASSRLIAKALALSREAVKSGIASDAQTIVSRICRKEGGQDGAAQK